MKESKKTKKITLVETSVPKISTEEKKQLEAFLLKLPEERAIKLFSDEYLDKEQEKRTLLRVGEISIEDVERNIQNKARKYAPMFPIVYFREIYRLFGFPIKEADAYFRRREVAIFTREVIYSGRFGKGVLMSLHVLNPYSSYIKRNYKHFQFMTPEGIEKLATIISECIEVMEECNTMLEFRKKWCAKYGVPYQSKMY